MSKRNLQSTTTFNIREVVADEGLRSALESATTPDDFLARAVQLLGETLSLDSCTLVSLEGATPRPICTGFDRAEHPRRRPRSPAISITPQAAALLQQGRFLILPAANSPIAELPAENRIGKILFLPLMRQQHYFGTLQLLDANDQREWQEEELNWAQAIATHCAIALENETYRQRCQQQQEWQQLFERVGKTLNSTLELEKKFSAAMAHLGEYFGIDRVMLVRIDDSHLWVEHQWLASEEIPSALGGSIPREEWPELTADTLDSICYQTFQTTDLIEYCRDRTQSQQAIAESQALSSLSIPIWVRDRLFGWLTLQTTLAANGEIPSTPRTFSQDEIKVLDNIVQLLGLAATGLHQEEQLQQEVTERTEQLESANRAKSEFLSTMSHELRAPLTSVLGFARVLLERIYGELNDKQAQYISAISDSGEHLLSLIEDLLDISKIEANKEELYLETLSVEEVCLSSLSLLQERAHAAGLNCQLELHPEVTVCCADRRRLKQILVNLLSNAIKFTTEGSVTLEVRCDTSQLYFSVIDTGIGIDEDDLRTLFQPFQQIQTPLHRKHKGSGLGLALSRKLARLHGGDLGATSVAGKGSCFTLTLPLDNQPTDG